MNEYQTYWISERLFWSIRNAKPSVYWIFKSNNFHFHNVKKKKNSFYLSHCPKCVCVCRSYQISQIVSWKLRYYSHHFNNVPPHWVQYSVKSSVQSSSPNSWHLFILTSYNKNRIQKPTNETVISHWNESMLNWQFAFRMFDNRIKQKKTVSLKMIRMVQLVWRRHEHTTTKAFQFDFAHLESAQLHV